MRLIIVRENGLVSIDGAGYSGIDMASIDINIHAVQWYETYGDVEFIEVNGIKPQNERIVSIEQYQTVIDLWNVRDYEYKNPPAPPPPTAAENKSTAMRLLNETDWTTIADVADPIKSNPYLTNQTDFILYRNIIRKIAINPVDGFIDFPAKPTAVWSA
jgi:hypothetical protein